MIDASVVIGAVARGDLIVTADRTDLDRFATALGVRVEIVDV